MIHPLMSPIMGGMRRIIGALAVAVALLALPAVPAQADDPPIESGESIPISGNGDCHRSWQRPYASANHVYLQAFFQVTCSVVGSTHRIIRMHTEAKYGSSYVGGGWTQYSDAVAERGNNVNAATGSITYNPHRDGCNWGQDWNYYRQRVDVDIDVRNLATGNVALDSITFYQYTTVRIPCGVHE
jgi:hypothetical protein